MHVVFALVIGSVILDAMAHPGSALAFHRRSLAGTWLLVLVASANFGLGLAVTGNMAASCAFSLALVALFTFVSNAKRALLGEALLFSDLALLGAVFRHPQFYLSALSTLQKFAMVMASVAIFALFYVLYRPDRFAHACGLAVLLISLILLKISLVVLCRHGMAAAPDHHADVARFGVLPTILLYWNKWSQTTDPVLVGPIATQPAPNELAIIIQCESFADPVELFGDSGLAMPGLAAARAHAWQWGNLLVSGFGAYTMRTEYGVLFGRSEEELAFRRYDPLLTALGEASYALPARLGWQSLFVHPYDMRFYNRAKIMPAAGFAELIGTDRFDPAPSGSGQYVSDAAIAEVVIDLAQTAERPTLIYAVTIENHGPWKASATDEDLSQSYLRLVRMGDAMLASLARDLAALNRPTTLVFFGDHRPSIPGHTAPDGPRHTPYVIMRFDAAGQPLPGKNRQVDLTPAQLHHALLGLWGSP